MRQITYCILLIVLIVSKNTSAQNISTCAGNGEVGHSGDGGPSTAAQLTKPTGIAIDNNNNIFFVDQAAGLVREINSNGIISTIAGLGTGPGLGDGGGALMATFSNPVTLALDNAGNIFIADNGNRRIRKINTSGIISTFAGGGTGSDGSLATDAQLFDPSGIAIDQNENVYISDGVSNCIRMVNGAGIISTIAGSNGVAGYSGDGGLATDATLYYPLGITFDGYKNLYIADYNNSCIRRVDTSGIISTFAGTIGSPIFSGDGGPATSASLQFPTNISTDFIGNIYICDRGNEVIRKVNSAGIISTIAGSILAGFSGDNGPATNAKLNQPYGVAALGNGNLFITDANNHRIRRVVSKNIKFANGHHQTINVCASNIHDNIDSFLSIIDSNIGFIATWSVMQAPAHGSLFTSNSILVTQAFSTPSGLTYAPTPGYHGIDSFKIFVNDGLTHDSTKIIVTQVQPLLSGIISGPDSVCVGASITLSDTVSGGYWSASNTNVVLHGSVANGIAVGFDTITYSVSNLCATVNSPGHVIKIIQTPTVAPITGTTEICNGSTGTLEDATSGGNWVCSNNRAIISGGIYTAIYNGLDTISYSVTNICGTTTNTIPVTIDIFPVSGIITGPSSVCQSSLISLTDTIPGGVWSATNTNAIVNPSGQVQGNSGGTDTIIYSVTNVCGTAYSNKSISVLPYTGGVITGDTFVCVGSVVTLTDTANGGIGVWNTTNSHATISGNTVTGSSVGIDTIRYSVTNLCGTAVAFHRIAIKPLPNPGIIAGGDSVCSGATLSLSDSGITGVWLAINAHASISTIGVVSGISAGIDTIIFTTNSGFCSADTRKYIWVKPYPDAGVIQGPGDVCIGSTITLTDSITGGTWSQSNNLTSFITIPSGIEVTGVTQGVNIEYYSKTNECGSTIVSKIINIHPLVNAGIIIGPTSVCQGSSITLSSTVTGGNWSVSNSDASLAVSSGTAILTGNNTGYDTLFYVKSNFCDTATTNLIIFIEMNPASGSINGNSDVCVGGYDTLHATPAGGTWNKMVGNVSVSAGVVHGITNGKDTVLYSVLNTCGNAVDSFPINIVSSGAACTLGAAIIKPQSPDFELYPNPTSDELTIISALLLEENIRLRITDVMGKTIYDCNSCTIIDGQYKLSVSNWHKGIYIIEFYTKDIKITKRFTVE